MLVPSASESQRLKLASHLSVTPGHLARQPVMHPVPPGGGSARRDSTVNYEVDKTVQRVRNQTGNIKRLSAAVVRFSRRARAV